MRELNEVEMGAWKKKEVMLTGRKFREEKEESLARKNKRKIILNN